MTGNDNIAIGDNAGFNTGFQRVLLPTESANSAGRQKAASLDAQLEATTSSLNGLTGSDNIASGHNPGIGSATVLSDTVALGRAAAIGNSGSIAIGLSARSTANSAIALGASSLADKDNTLSVGSVGSERRITNVANGVEKTDATNLQQLTATEQRLMTSVANVNRHANRGIAMAMAQSSTAPLTSASGEPKLGVGAGSYGDANAFSLGLAGTTRNGTQAFRLAASLAPGASDIGMEASMQWKLGKAAPNSQIDNEELRQLRDQLEAERVVVYATLQEAQELVQQYKSERLQHTKTI